LLFKALERVKSPSLGIKIKPSSFPTTPRAQYNLLTEANSHYTLPLKEAYFNQIKWRSRNHPRGRFWYAMGEELIQLMTPTGQIPGNYLPVEK
jgi:hypothetical protein